MAWEPTYKTAEDALRAIDLAVEDTIMDQPNLKGQEDSVYWEICQSLQYECAPDVAREVARRSGVDCVYPKEKTKVRLEWN